MQNNYDEIELQRYGAKMFALGKSAGLNKAVEFSKMYASVVQEYYGGGVFSLISISDYYERFYT